MLKNTITANKVSTLAVTGSVAAAMLSQVTSVYAWDWKLTSAVSCTDNKVVLSVTSPSKELAGTYTLVFTPSNGGSGFTSPMTYDGKSATEVVATVGLDKFGTSADWNVFLNQDNNVKNSFTINCPKEQPTPTPAPQPTPQPENTPTGSGGGTPAVLAAATPSAQPQALPDTGPEAAGVFGSAGLLGLGAVLRGVSKLIKKSA